MAITQGKAETAALEGSTEAEQFDSGVLGYKAGVKGSPSVDSDLKI